MSEYKGKFTFPSQTFDFSNFDQGDKLFIDQLNYVKDINDKDVRYIVINFDSPILITIVFTDGTFSNHPTNLSNINQDLDTILFDGDIDGIGRLMTTSTDTSINNQLKNCIDNTVNCYFLYQLNSPKNAVSKQLNFVYCDYMKYNKPIGYKNMQLDIKQDITDERFNYIYLTVLNRYYYVDKCVLINGFTQMDLSEDVLMSFSDLIRSQTAFVTRNEFTYNSDLTDELVHMDYNKSITYETITLDSTKDIFSNVGKYILITVG